MRKLPDPESNSVLPKRDNMEQAYYRRSMANYKKTAMIKDHAAFIQTLTPEEQSFLQISDET